MKDAGRRFKAGVVAGLDVCGNARHGEGRADEQCKVPKENKVIKERTEERNRVLHCCMSEITPDYREVLYLTYFEDMSYAQAAEVTGKTVKQITNMVYRGKKSLRRLLEREGITDAES